MDGADPRSGKWESWPQIENLDILLGNVQSNGGMGFHSG